MEADNEKLPFSRSQRSLVYARAKNEVGDRPFGTLMDVYRDWLRVHRPFDSARPDARPGRLPHRASADRECTQPYSASVLQHFGDEFWLTKRQRHRALNKGREIGGFAHDTGEGSISPYHREHGGDLIWEIGSGYFGCRDADGNFDPKRFAAQAAADRRSR